MRRGRRQAERYSDHVLLNPVLFGVRLQPFLRRPLVGLLVALAWLFFGRTDPRRQHVKVTVGVLGQKEATSEAHDGVRRGHTIPANGRTATTGIAGNETETNVRQSTAADDRFVDLDVGDLVCCLSR